MTKPDGGPAPSHMAIALAPMVNVWTELLLAHVPGQDGRCRKCQWQVRSAERWPCRVYDLADAARRFATSSTPGR